MSPPGKCYDFLSVIVLYALKQSSVSVHLLSMLHPSERNVMTWVQYCVIEMDDLFYYLCFVCMCMCAYTPRVLREHIVTLVVFGHQRPSWQRLKWWLKTGGLDRKMWINEAQIELIAMTSHNNEATKWEYVVGPPKSQCLFRFQGDGRSKEGKVLSADLPNLFTLDKRKNKSRGREFSYGGHSLSRNYIHNGPFCSADAGSSVPLINQKLSLGWWMDV